MSKKWSMVWKSHRMWWVRKFMMYIQSMFYVVPVHKTVNNLYIYNTLWKTTLKSNHSFCFCLLILVPTECRLPPWSISLIVLSALFMVNTLVVFTVTIIDGICCIHLRKHEPNIGDCCGCTKQEIGKGEYDSVILILVVVALFSGPCFV